MAFVCESGYQVELAADQRQRLAVTGGRITTAIKAAFSGKWKQHLPLLLSSLALLVSVAHMPPLLANVAGFLVAFFVSFGGHARWTFPTPSHERGSARRRFFVLALTSFLLNQASYAWALHWAGERWYLPALGFVLVGVSGVTFILANVWAFAPKRSSRLR